MKRRRRAIVLDDNKDILTIIALILERRGYEVITYADPTECPLFQSHECHCAECTACTDVLITDVNMTHVSGLDFVESQLAKGCKLKNIAFISGAWGDEDLERARRLGCKTFSKPVTLAELWAWLDACEARTDQPEVLSDWFCQGCSRE